MAKAIGGQIIVAGSLAYDNILSFPGHFKDHILPDKVHMINISLLLENVERQRGGCAANIAYTLSLLGRRPRVVAAAGYDFGDYEKYLSEAGIDTSGIFQSKDKLTASCFIYTDRDNNQITGFYSGAMQEARNLSLAKESGKQPAVCIIAPDDPEAMVRHCKEAKEAGIPLVYDPSFQVAALDGEQLYEGAKGCKVLILNDYEFAVFKEKTGVSKEKLLEDVECVVVTLGGKGSEIYLQDQPMIKVEPAKPGKVVDPTGAGDAYRGGFLAGMVEGRSWQECGQMGSVAAVYAIEHFGTQNHHYSQHEFFERYCEHFGQLAATSSPV